jgi:hypothetical protein
LTNGKEGEPVRDVWKFECEVCGEVEGEEVVFLASWFEHIHGGDAKEVEEKKKKKKKQEDSWDKVSDEEKEKEEARR